MKKSFFFLLIFEFLIFNFAFSDTHYVSKTGLDVYPYTSWTTAADSIQKGINAASAGDTVRVGPGSYMELLTMIPGIALIGAGMESCVIPACRVAPPNYTVIQGADSSTVEGFYLDGCDDYTYSYGVRVSGGMKITNNRISGFTEGIVLYDVAAEISNNIFEDNRDHICSFDGRGLIVGNTFTRGSHAMWLYGCRGIGFVKNVIANAGWDAIYVDGLDSLFIENNLIVADSYNDIAFVEHSCGLFKNVPIRNNTLIGNSNHAVVIIIGFSSEIKNNIISGGSCGIAASPYCLYHHGMPYDCSYSHPQVSYNDLWSNVKNYLVDGGCSIDTSLGGNIYLDPMFVGSDDYHLQYGSPCIDAGDPNIKDPDSSRSDIGCFGGRWGETYAYQDYPPKAPDSLTATSSQSVITLSWKPNTESDLSHYLVYRDTLTGFIPDSFKIVGQVPKDSSVFRDSDVVLGRTYYYRVSAWDSTGHESEYSDELPILATYVDESTEEGPPMPRMYQLRQNYPNPFNPTTTIVYYLPDVGYQPAEVEIVIYNLLAQKVRTLVKERKYPGEHRVTWDGKDDAGNDLASGIYFYKLTFSGVDLFPLVKPKKMVLVR
jgi:parallel beta-helix repeat protein